MSALLSCPRCTQALPASAKFCRRCGAAAGWQDASRINAPPAWGKHGPIVSSALAALLIAALIMGSLVVHHVREVPGTAPATPLYSYPVPVQSAYPPPNVPRYNNDPPVVVIPEYSGRVHSEHPHREYGR